MPIYEYICHQCRHKFSLLVRAANGHDQPHCPRCAAAQVSRLFSIFSVRSTSDKNVYEDILSDQRLTRGMLSDDPRALAEWNKKMSRGLDEETPPEYREALDRMEKGELPSPEMMRELKGEGVGTDWPAGEEES